MFAAEVNVPQMFTAYAEDRGYPSRLHHYQYFCEECDQVFAAAWGRKTGCMGWFERGNYFYCPNCSEKHEKHVVCIQHPAWSPNKVRLSVKTYKTSVVLEVTCTTLQFTDFQVVTRGKSKEVFRFDIAKQAVTFSRSDNGCETEPMEIGNPFKLEILDKSILEFFMPGSMAVTNQRAELVKLLRTLREAVRGKLEKHLGHKVSSMHASPGQRHGLFLLPILNMAYRVMFPDAPNLPAIYREIPATIQRFWEMKMISEHGYMDDIIKLIKYKGDFVKAMVDAGSLPDRPAVRKILSEDPFEFSRLTEAFALCRNYDYAVRLYSGLKAFKIESSYMGMIRDLVQFLRGMLPLYGEAGAVCLVEEADKRYLQDCVRLYHGLTDENRQALQAERVKLSDLHDWMARTHRKQNHVNLKFNVPDHIVRRLSMQTDRLKFFMPAESMELLEAGAELHNCVASYGGAMKDNNKWIVLVADERGKLAACLEVRGKELLQAKVDRNRLVASDPVLNREVLAWAKEAGLVIKTKDVEPPAVATAAG
ncbi:MAG: PcfJ domain-containing protein [Eubacteriales bacterium]|jgi:hypothetical protein